MNYGMKIKRWWHSRTMWLNITSIAALAPLASAMMGYIDLIGLSEMTAARISMALSLFVALCNLYLRKNSPVAIGEESDV